MTLTMAKFRVHSYDPAEDSSDHPVVSEFKGNHGVVLVQEQYEENEQTRLTCLSGSLKRTSKKASFAPGMDARYKGILTRAHCAAVPITHVVVDEDGDLVSKEQHDPMDLAKPRGWDKYLTSGWQRHHQKAQKEAKEGGEEAEPPEESSDEPSIGDPYTVTYRKKERTGTVVEVDSDYLIVEIELQNGNTKEVKVER